jgi:hypothetical protein
LPTGAIEFSRFRSFPSCLAWHVAPNWRSLIEKRYGGVRGSLSSTIRRSRAGIEVIKFPPINEH